MNSFQDEILNSEFFLNQPASFQNAFKLYPPWNFYLYHDEFPTRVYGLTEKRPNEYYAKCYVVGESAEIYNAEVSVSADEIKAISNWTDEHIAKIKAAFAYLPGEEDKIATFTNKLGYIGLLD